MKNCPQCGNVLDEAQQFCTRCGNQLATATPAPAASEPLPPPPPAGAPPPPPSPPPPVQPNPTAVPPPPVATPAYSPPSGPLTPPPPPPPTNKSKWWIWLIVAFVVIGLIIGLVIWVSGSTRRALLQSSENIRKEFSEIAVSPTPTPMTTVSPTPTTTPTVTPVPQADPEVVVANFLNSSLGTLPGSRVDYNKAWVYLGDNLKALYPDGSYLPLLLCIQDGPSAVDISEPAFLDMAYVNVLANYGGSWINMWEFGLQEKNGLWQIVEISCLSQY